MAKTKVKERMPEPAKPSLGFITVEKVPGKYRVRRYNPDGTMLERWSHDAFSVNQHVSQLRGADDVQRKDIEFDADPGREWNDPMDAPLDGTEFEGKIQGDPYTIYQSIYYNKDEQVFYISSDSTHSVTLTAWRPRLIKRKA